MMLGLVRHHGGQGHPAVPGVLRGLRRRAALRHARRSWPSRAVRATTCWCWCWRAAGLVVAWVVLGRRAGSGVDDRPRAAAHPVPGPPDADVRDEPARAHALGAAGGRPAAGERDGGGRRTRSATAPWRPPSRARPPLDPRGQEPHHRARVDAACWRTSRWRWSRWASRPARSATCSTAVADFYDEELDTQLATVHGPGGAGDAGAHGGRGGGHAARLLPAAVPGHLGASSDERDDGAAAAASARPPAPPPSEEEAAARALAARYRLEYVDVAVLRARPRDPAVGAGRADVPLQLPALPPRGRPAGAGDGRSHRHPGGGRADACCCRRRSSPRSGTPSAIQEALKRGQGTQRVLEQASESFKIQILHDDENGEEVLSIDKIQADASPIIRLVDSAVFDALEPPRLGHPHRDPRHRGGDQVPHRRRAAVGHEADRQGAPLHDHQPHQGHGRAGHRGEARAAGRPLPRAHQGPQHRLPRLDHAVRARRGRGHPHPRQGEPVASSSPRCAWTSWASTRRSWPASAASSASPTGWCWSPVPPARARPRRSTPPCPRSSPRRTRSSPSRTRSSTSCAGSRRSR